MTDASRNHLSLIFTVPPIWKLAATLSSSLKVAPGPPVFSTAVSWPEPRSFWNMA
jgi:hypothetical protein